MCYFWYNEKQCFCFPSLNLSFFELVELRSHSMFAFTGLVLVVAYPVGVPAKSDKDMSSMHMTMLGDRG